MSTRLELGEYRFCLLWLLLRRQVASDHLFDVPFFLMVHFMDRFWNLAFVHTNLEKILT